MYSFRVHRYNDSVASGKGWGSEKLTFESWGEMYVVVAYDGNMPSNRGMKKKKKIKINVYTLHGTRTNKEFNRSCDAGINGI